MKGFLCFLAALIGYLVLGLVIWNIVCTVINADSIPIIKLSDYRLCAYSGVTLLIVFICGILAENNIYDYAFYVVLAILGVGIAVNHWESVFDSVALILTFVYHVANIVVVSFSLYYAFPD